MPRTDIFFITNILFSITRKDSLFNNSDNIYSLQKKTRTEHSPFLPHNQYITNYY